jgi:hypothetical protein
MQVLLECCNIWKVHNGKIEIVIGQGMKQTYLYLWYLLFQAKFDRCDQRNHQIQNYLVKGHHLYSGT